MSPQNVCDARNPAEHPKPLRNGPAPRWSRAPLCAVSQTAQGRAKDNKGGTRQGQREVNRTGREHGTRPVIGVVTGSTLVPATDKQAVAEEEMHRQNAGGRLQAIDYNFR